MSGGADRSDGEAAAIAATLTDLAQKLAELRELVRQAAVDLNARRISTRGARTVALPTTRSARLPQLIAATTSTEGRVCCHECGRAGPGAVKGWTLRLCGDDELHTFCPDCDRRYFNGTAGNASATGPDLLS